MDEKVLETWLLHIYLPKAHECCWRQIFNRFWHSKPHPTPALLFTGLNFPWRLIQIKDFTLLIKCFGFCLESETVYLNNYFFFLFLTIFSDLNGMKSLLRSKVSWVLIVIICKCYLFTWWDQPSQLSHCPVLKEGPVSYLPNWNSASNPTILGGWLDIAGD